MSNKSLWRLTLEIDHNFEDIIIWKLDDLGIFSYAINYIENKEELKQILIWLPKSDWDQKKKEELEIIFRNFFNYNGYQLNSFCWVSLEEEDWLNSWKQYWEPTPIGKNFLILPSWMELPKRYQNKSIIRIEPGAAFGTGSHPSTALCLEMVENISIKGKKILDVGCGSGILSIASKKLGGSIIHCIDNDYLAIRSTKENLKLNFGQFIDSQLFEGSFLEIANKNILTKYDLVLCNILANVIIPLIPDLYKILSLNGKLILSGIISSQKEEIIKILNLYYLKVDHVLSKKDWVCIRASK